MAVMGIIRLVTLLLHLSLYLNWFLCSLSTVWDSVKNRESSCGTRQEMWERQTPAGRSGGKPRHSKHIVKKRFRLWWLGGQVIRCPCGSLLQSRVSHWIDWRENKKPRTFYHNSCLETSMLLCWGNLTVLEWTRPSQVRWARTSSSPQPECAT